VAGDPGGLVSIPNAFTPNGDGLNDRFLVFGEDITAFHLQVFNRWGELVFESFDQDAGWDGRFNGIDQRLEVYAYVVRGSFTDGTAFTRSGNVTLMR
jgi:gliding motility-associated-like protein